MHFVAVYPAKKQWLLPHTHGKTLGEIPPQTVAMALEITFPALWGLTGALPTHLPLAKTEGKPSSPAGKGPVPAFTFTLASHGLSGSRRLSTAGRECILLWRAVGQTKLADIPHLCVSHSSSPESWRVGKIGRCLCFRVTNVELVGRINLFLNLWEISGHVNQATAWVLEPLLWMMITKSHASPLQNYVQTNASHPLPDFSVGVWYCFCLHDSFIVIINKTTF